jgi:pyruvate/2-oxoglutarate dehydrogenase complex dihydrolipoamide dehydrogenase (E3) component
MSDSYDVVVLGGGTAGLVTASGCARLGRRVALIEREALGGDCLWTGCVPTKALVATAKLLHQMQHADRWGLTPQRPEVTPRAVMESMRETIRVTSKHDHPDKFRALGVDVIEGTARLVSKSEMAVGNRRLVAKDIVLATGSRTAVPPIEGLAAAGYLDHRTFLAQDAFPPSLLILGGGSIGTEFAQIVRRFGSEVTIVEMLDELVPREDTDIIARIRELFRAEGIAVRTGWTVRSVRVENGKKIASIENRAGQREELAADEIFVASGRRGNSEDLGLEEAGVQLERSYVHVDRYLQTSVPRIWACGDIHGGMQFTHVAAYEAVKLVRNLLFPGKSAVDYTHIPWGLYTDPEVGHIGMTEREAVASAGKENVRTYRVELADVDRAVVDRTPQGLLKFVCDAKGHILGAHAMCANASTLIETIVLARRNGMKIGDLAQLTSPYPSLADAIGKAASLYYQDLGASWLGTIGKRIAAWSQ